MTRENMNLKRLMFRALSSDAFRWVLLAVTVPQMLFNIYMAHEGFNSGDYLLAAIHIACFVALGVSATFSVKIWLKVKKMQKENGGKVIGATKVSIGDKLVVTVAHIGKDGQNIEVMHCSQEFTGEGLHSHIRVNGDAEALIMAALSSAARALVEGAVSSCDCATCDKTDCDSRKTDSKKVH